MILEAKNLITYYGKAQALRGVSLAVGEGQIVTLLGANGAGKTTTLMTISGVIRPRSGSVVYKGREITSMRPAAIVGQGLAHCPEGRGPVPGDERGRQPGAGGPSCKGTRARFRPNRSASTATSPAWPSAAARWPAPFPAASSRCWPSAGP